MKRGKFHSIKKPLIEELVLEFDPEALTFDWENCDSISQSLTDSIRSTLSHKYDEAVLADVCGTSNYLINEFIENAYKFRAGGNISLKIEIADDEIGFFLKNQIDEKRTQALLEFIDRIEKEDAQKLYLETIEKNAENSKNKSSLIGFLSMICDYKLRLGWEWVKEGKQTVLITKAQYTF